MRKHPITALITLIVTVLVLVSCGSDSDSESTPTVEPTVAAVATAAPTRSTEITSLATPAATEESAVLADATPVESPEATEQASILANATPVGSPVATPVVASTGDERIETVALTGALILEGREQQDYTLGTEGCVGLGEWRSLKPGAQVIVRDASGTVTDVTTLEAIDNGDSCEWVFTIDAPTSDFFSVSIPMVTEVWFSQDDAEVQHGDIELIVP